MMAKDITSATTSTVFCLLFSVDHRVAVAFVVLEVFQEARDQTSTSRTLNNRPLKSHERNVLTQQLKQKKNTMNSSMTDAVFQTTYLLLFYATNYDRVRHGYPPGILTVYLCT